MQDKLEDKKMQSAEYNHFIDFMVSMYLKYGALDIKSSLQILLDLLPKTTTGINNGNNRLKKNWNLHIRFK